MFWWIFFATFISMFGETLPQSFQPLFLSTLGLTPSVIGLVYNIRNLVQTFLRIPSGNLSDIFGSRRLMILGLTLISLVPLLYSIADSAILPLLAMMISGIGMSIYFTPSMAYASSLFPPNKTGEALGKYHMSWAASAVIGPSIGGFLATLIPSYRSLFVVAGLITSFSLLIIFFNTEDSSPGCPINTGDEIRKTLVNFPETMKRFMGQPQVLIGSLSVFTHAFCHWSLSTFIPLFASGLGYSEFIIGLTLAANAFMIAISLPLIGIISDRIGRIPPPLFRVLLSAYLLLLIFPSLIEYGCCLF
jgi:MFS family permease